MSENITYTLVSGELPQGVTLGTDGVLKGMLRYINVADEPSWTTPQGMLGRYRENDPVDLTLLAKPSPTANTVKFTLLGNEVGNFKGLPWGLRLDATTGKITGTLDSLLVAEPPTWRENEIPLWITNSGNLGTFNEFDLVDLTVSATPQYGSKIARYVVNQGQLPWGLMLDSTTGKIQGTVDRLLVSDIGDRTPVPNPPVFNTMAMFQGSPIDVSSSVVDLGTLERNVSFNLSLTATPTAGRTIQRYAVVAKPGKTLPYGISLSSSTGVFSGTISIGDFNSGSYSFDMIALDNAGAIAKRSFKLTVVEPVITVDPYWDNVLFLQGWDAPTGDKPATDESTYSRPITYTGSIATSTVTSKFGGGSLRAPGSTNLASVPNSLNWVFAASEPFTIETWASFDTAITNGQILGQWDNNTAAQRAIHLTISGSRLYAESMSQDGGTNYSMNAPFVPVPGQWYHLAVDRNAAGDFRLYVDGVMVAKRAGYTVATRSVTTATWTFGGCLGSTSVNMVGYLDETRITKGVARYDTDTNFPVPTMRFGRKK